MTATEAAVDLIKKSSCYIKPLPIDSFLKLLASTQGRDKLYRLLQYFSRFLAFYLGKMCPTMEFVMRLQKLSISLGMARKRKLNRRRMCLINFFCFSFQSWKTFGQFTNYFKKLQFKG